MTTLTEMIAGIPAGKTFGISPRKASEQKLPFYVVVRKTADGYQIEAAWEDRKYDAAAAADSGDNSRLIGWGYEVVRSATTADEAAAIYTAAKAALQSRRTPAAALAA
jgi:hypothetical protein